MFEARLDVVKDERARRAMETMAIIEGFRAKRFTAKRAKELVKAIAGEDILKTELTPEQQELLRESRERVRLQREGKPWQK